MLQKQYYVYILTNRANNVLYCGITENLITRVSQHKQHIAPSSFTAKYHVDKLVFYEIYQDPKSAIRREKQIKSGSREKKIKLIEKMNRTWEDLHKNLLD